jgi:hypothetical protein
MAVLGVHCDGDPAATTDVADLQTGKVAYTLAGQGGAGMSISPDGTRFVRQEADGATWGTLSIRDLETGQLLVELDGLCEFDSVSIEPSTNGKDAGRTPRRRSPCPRSGCTGHRTAECSPPGSRGGAIVWDTASGEMLHAETAPETSLWLSVAEGNWAWDVALSRRTPRG